MAKPMQAQRGRDTNGDVSLEMSGSSQGSFDAGENRGEAAGPGAALAEVRPLLVWLHRALPFLILLLLKLGFQHRTGLAILIGLFVTFSYGNHLVKSQVARGEKRSSIRALLMALYLMGNVLFLYYCFHSQNLHLSLLFLPPSLEPLHLWDLLWVVGITDFIIKFGTVFLKTLLLALPQALLPFRHRGSCYEVVEEGSLLYRVLAPVRLWVTFLVHSSLDGFLLGFALSILYLLLKCMTVYSRLPCLGRACFKLWHCQPMGLPASKQQCAQAGQLCPICQGNFCRPALLLCQHVFCEECIGLWLDRERCCPLCRLIVWEGGRRGRDGGTSTHLQLY